MNLDLIINFTQEQLKNETTGHDFYHGQRVARLAKKMYQKDNPDFQDNHLIDLILAAGYLHDTIDEKICANPEVVINKIIHMLNNADLSSNDIDEILFIIEHMSFSKNIEQHYQLSTAGQYVQDADRIESLGAIGIARTFAYGGKHSNKIYDPKIEPKKLINHDQYRNHEETSINHFYEKLFNLKTYMNTPSGKREAKERTQYMQEFVKKFMSEWDV